MKRPATNQRSLLKKILLAPLFLAGACVACCAAPLLLPAVLALLTTSVATLGGLNMGLTFALSIALMSILFSAIKRWRPSRADTCQITCPTTTATKACDCQAEQQA